VTLNTLLISENNEKKKKIIKSSLFIALAAQRFTVAGYQTNTIITSRLCLSSCYYHKVTHVLSKHSRQVYGLFATLCLIWRPSCEFQASGTADEFVTTTRPFGWFERIQN